MMSSPSDHHARAEQLLGQAPKEQDSIRRSQILAEAQVHATLALSAPDGTGPPGLGQPETGYAWGRAQDRFEGSAGFGLQPYGPGGGGAPGRRGRAPRPPGPPPPRGTGNPRPRARRARAPPPHRGRPPPPST